MSIKLQIDDAQLARLQDIQGKTGLPDLKALFNEAMTLYKWAVEKKAEGKPIAAIDEQNKKYVEVELPGLQNVQPVAANPAPTPQP